MIEVVDVSETFAEIGTLCFWDDKCHVNIKVWFTDGVDRPIEVGTIACQYILAAFDQMTVITAELDYAMPNLTSSFSSHLADEQVASIRAYVPSSSCGVQ
jgi:hypothetical protein